MANGGGSGSACGGLHATRAISGITHRAGGENSGRANMYPKATSVAASGERRKGAQLSFLAALGALRTHGASARRRRQLAPSGRHQYHFGISAIRQAYNAIDKYRKIGVLAANAHAAGKTARSRRSAPSKYPRRALCRALCAHLARSRVAAKISKQAAWRAARCSVAHRCNSGARRGVSAPRRRADTTAGERRHRRKSQANVHGRWAVRGVIGMAKWRQNRHLGDGNDRQRGNRHLKWRQYQRGACAWHRSKMAASLARASPARTAPRGAAPLPGGKNVLSARQNNSGSGKTLCCCRRRVLLNASSR